MEQTILPTVAADLPLAPEVPVELLVNGTKLATLMCTPLNLDDLALGHLVGRGMLADLATVLSVGACADLRQANVICGEGLLADRYGLAAVIASGCGSGGALRTATELPPLAAAAGARVSLELLQGYARRMFEAAELYRKTGGMHCAALLGPPLAAGGSDRATGGEPAAERFFVVREDVGRHNAVDKVVGGAIEATGTSALWQKQQLTQGTPRRRLLQHTVQLRQRLGRLEGVSVERHGSPAGAGRAHGNPSQVAGVHNTPGFFSAAVARFTAAARSTFSFRHSSATEASASAECRTSSR